MKQINILVFPCGSEVGLELNRALRDIYFIHLVGASSTPDHGKYVYSHYVEGVPYIDSPDFIEKFNDIIRSEKIDFIYPAMDQVIDVLSEHREELLAPILAPENDAVHIARNKLKTYDRLQGFPFVPAVYRDPATVSSFPVIVKPQEGYGAKGVTLVHNADELHYVLTHSNTSNVICEYLPGEEYTIDCFTDRFGKIRYLGCRTRKRIRNGISVDSFLNSVDSKITHIADCIQSRINMRGAWFFQVKKALNGEYKLLEVATRIAGTMCVERAVGVNLPLLTIFDAMGYDVTIDQQFDHVEVDRALYNCFHLDISFSEIYLDFDDTIIINGSVNSNLMRFLYQCFNKKIPIILLTKHDGDIYKDLDSYRIPQNLFDKIIHLPNTDKKYTYIQPKPNALFLDDSFAERHQMRTAHEIYALGVDAIDCLIDYSC